MPWDLMENTVWHQSLSGLELARRQSWGTSPDRHADYVRSSPCSMANCGQHLLEPILLAAAQRSSFADIRLNHELLDLHQDDSGVVATVQDRAGDEELMCRTSYLVGSDGGRSTVARAIGLEYAGMEAISASATIHFHADLARFTAYRPGALYWNAVPGQGGFRGGGTLICHRPWHEWALAFSFDPEVEDATNKELAVKRLHRIIGDDSVTIEIKNISTWWINRMVARKYSVGRVFCMGDAVHRHPPTNGLGLNTSVGDAYNLAWKLAMVVNGHAGQKLLDTYSEERQPHGRSVVERAFASIRDMELLREAFEFNAHQTEEETDPAIARLYEADANGAQHRAAIDDALARTDYQFNAHGVEVGYRYRSGAIVSDGTPEPAFRRDPDLYDNPTTWPGAHLPHVWLEGGVGRVSSLDVVSPDGLTLITGIGGDAWSETARIASVATGVAITVRFVGTRDGLKDCYGDWRRFSEVSESGCVLVRPDRHVAWRAFEVSADAVVAFPSVVAALLGTTPLRQPGWRSGT